MTQLPSYNRKHPIQTQFFSILNKIVVLTQVVGDIRTSLQFLTVHNLLFFPSSSSQSAAAAVANASLF